MSPVKLPVVNALAGNHPVVDTPFITRVSHTSSVIESSAPGTVCSVYVITLYVPLLAEAPDMEMIFPAERDSFENLPRTSSRAAPFMVSNGMLGVVIDTLLPIPNTTRRCGVCLS